MGRVTFACRLFGGMFLIIAVSGACTKAEPQGSRSPERHPADAPMKAVPPAEGAESEKEAADPSLGEFPSSREPATLRSEPEGTARAVPARPLPTPGVFEYSVATDRVSQVRKLNPDNPDESTGTTVITSSDKSRQSTTNTIRTEGGETVLRQSVQSDSSSSARWTDFVSRDSRTLEVANGSVHDECTWHDPLTMFDAANTRWESFTRCEWRTGSEVSDRRRVVTGAITRTTSWRHKTKEHAAVELSETIEEYTPGRYMKWERTSVVLTEYLMPAESKTTFTFKEAKASGQNTVVAKLESLPDQ